MTIEERVKAVIRIELGIPNGVLCRDENFIYNFGADALDIVGLIAAIEEEFGICIPDEDADKLETVGQMIDYVKSKVEK